MFHNEVIKVVVDLGGSQVRAAVVKLHEKYLPEVMGLGFAEHEGIRDGHVVNINALATALRQAVDNAETEAGVKVNSAILSVSHAGLLSLNIDAAVTLRAPHVTLEDIDAALVKARDSAVRKERYTMIHALQQSFAVDDYHGIHQPLNMPGNALRALLHIIHLPNDVYRLWAKCADLAGIHLEYAVFSGLASSLAVMSGDDHEAGCCVVDIGQGTTKVMVWRAGVPLMSKVLPVGGAYVSSDLAELLNIPRTNAEILKCSQIRIGMPYASDMVSVSASGMVGRKTFSQEHVAKIVEARYEQLFEVIYQELRRAGYDKAIRGRFILTGGGAKMQGLPDFLQQKWRVHARLEQVRYLPDNPLAMQDEQRFATLAGMIGLFESPIRDVAWAKVKKNSIIGSLMSFFRRLE